MNSLSLHVLISVYLQVEPLDASQRPKKPTPPRFPIFPVPGIGTGGIPSLVLEQECLGPCDPNTAQTEPVGATGLHGPRGSLPTRNIL